MEKIKKLTNDQIVKKIYSDPKYAGKHIVAIAGKIYASKDPRDLDEKFEELRKKFPKEIPLITYIPPRNTILIV